MEEKRDLRKILLTERKILDASTLKSLTHLVWKNLTYFLLDREFETVHCFEPIESLAELDVIDLFKGKDLFTSKKKDSVWEIVPLDSKITKLEKFDLIIVPMLGFDSTLNRIGYGGGYYDKFLANQPNALKVGVCLEQGKVERLPIEPHDIPLDVIITDSAIYQR